MTPPTANTPRSRRFPGGGEGRAYGGRAVGRQPAPRRP